MRIMLFDDLQAMSKLVHYIEHFLGHHHSVMLSERFLYKSGSVCSALLDASHFSFSANVRIDLARHIQFIHAN